MSGLYESLLNQYKNRSYWIDNSGTKGVILHNEPVDEVKKLIALYKVSNNMVFKIIEFVKEELTKGKDWRLYGKPEWEEVEKTAPKKKKKFIKPKAKHTHGFGENDITPQELIRKAKLKVMEPMTMYNVLDEMARTISLIPDQLKREVYVKKLSMEFDFDYEVLKKQVNIKRKNQNNERSNYKFR